VKCKLCIAYANKRYNMAYFAGHKRKTKSLQTVRYDCILVFHTHTQMFYGSPNFLRDNPGEPVPEETFTHSYLSCHQLSLNCFLHLPRSMASSLFQSVCLAVLFHNLFQSFLWFISWSGSSTLYFVHFFTQSLSSFYGICPYHYNLFCCSTEIM